ncbi:MAG: NfeD family protein [Acidimicrobiia bacterium]
MPAPFRHARTATPRQARPVRWLIAALVLAGALLAGPLGASSARAGGDDGDPGTGAESDEGRIVVVQVDGYIDPPNAELIRDSLSRAADHRTPLVVLQLSSPGSIDVDAQDLADDIAASRVPVAVWVGPSGASARGAGVLLAEAAHVAAMAPGSHIGPASPVALDTPGTPDPAETDELLRAYAERQGRPPEQVAALVDERYDAGEARRLGVVDRVEPTVGSLVVDLDGQVVEVDGDLVRLSTARVVGEGEQARRTPDPEVRFERLGLGDQILHTFTSPSIAYLLFVVGLLLIVFEFFTAGIGLAGLVGALALVGSIIGFGSLPVVWWAAALIVVGVLGLSIDVQAGGLGSWTFIGSACLAIGSWFLFGGSSLLDPPWWVLLFVVVGGIVFMLSAMTAVVRSRFSTPTVGREGMIGEMGTAEVDVDPDGVVRVRDALWRARTNRATPIGAGDPVRVVAVEGVELEVEPEEGGARDYRDRARGTADD